MKKTYQPIRKTVLPVLIAAVLLSSCMTVKQGEQLIDERISAMREALKEEIANDVLLTVADVDLTALNSLIDTMKKERMLAEVMISGFNGTLETLRDNAVKEIDQSIATNLALMNTKKTEAETILDAKVLGSLDIIEKSANEAVNFVQGTSWDAENQIQESKSDSLQTIKAAKEDAVSILEAEVLGSLNVLTDTKNNALALVEAEYMGSVAELQKTKDATLDAFDTRIATGITTVQSSFDNLQQEIDDIAEQKDIAVLSIAAIQDNTQNSMENLLAEGMQELERMIATLDTEIQTIKEQKDIAILAMAACADKLDTEMSEAVASTLACLEEEQLATTQAMETLLADYTAGITSLRKEILIYIDEKKEALELLNLGVNANIAQALESQNTKVELTTTTLMERMDTIQQDYDNFQKVLTSFVKSSY